MSWCRFISTFLQDLFSIREPLQTATCGMLSNFPGN